VNFRTHDHQPLLAAYAFLTYAVTLVLLYAGGFTTTIGAGMVFPDWPLSHGSLNPPGWTTDEAMLAEHSHRLLGMVVGTLCIGLAVWMQRREPRRWLRVLAWGALALVVFQGLLGGLRVLRVSVDLAKIHGVTAQVFVCVLVAVAVGASAWFRRLSTPSTADAAGNAAWRAARWQGWIICLLLIVQLAVGAVLRHRGAGLAIPYFPHANPSGGLLPVAWNWATTLHFTHRAGALVIYALFIGWFWRLLVLRSVTRVLARFGWLGLALLHIQILLGALIIWNVRQPMETTLHVLNGALFLSVCWAITFALHKPMLDAPLPSTKPACGCGAKGC
jgi:heme a synthase